MKELFNKAQLIEILADRIEWAESKGHKMQYAQELDFSIGTIWFNAQYNKEALKHRTKDRLVKAIHTIDTMVNR